MNHQQLNKLFISQKKLAQMQSSQEPSIKKPAIKISKITSIGKNNVKQAPAQYQPQSKLDRAISESSSATSTSSCSCEDHSDGHSHAGHESPMDHSPIHQDMDKNPHHYFDRRSPLDGPLLDRRPIKDDSSRGLSQRSMKSDHGSRSPHLRRKSPQRRPASPPVRRRPVSNQRDARRCSPRHEHRSPRNERRSPYTRRSPVRHRSPLDRSNDRVRLSPRRSPLDHRPRNQNLPDRKRRHSPIPRRYTPEQRKMVSRHDLDDHRDQGKRHRADSGNGHQIYRVDDRHRDHSSYREGQRDRRPVIREPPFHPREYTGNKTVIPPPIHDHSSMSGSSSKKSRDPAHLVRYFLKDAVYFVMKSNNQENVDMSMDKGVWSTPPQNQIKLDRAFEEFKNVLLVFSVKESGRFAGFARLSSMSIKTGAVNGGPEPVNWILPPGLINRSFDTLFYIDWICKCDLPFSLTGHLFNPLNEMKPVKVARDGQVNIYYFDRFLICQLFQSRKLIHWSANS